MLRLIIFPSAKIGGTNYIYVYSYNAYNWYGISVLNQAHNATNGAPGLSVMQAYSIDQKVDDGMPTTGNVRAMTITSVPFVTWPSLISAPNAASDSVGTCFNTTVPAYSIAMNNGSNVNCALSFRFQ